ncbi:hypothetical protein K1T71_001953 [Dendrolimus kikuchii]|uniref:Uncharacterized protein n=1 Tax=Dendrolimus kikuchii TaxID=765133 RepID=A0ACC1DF39_9NEOP|nr:hypothetical protein K1T71_001953 [Dendrolimus kikuchii]
MALVLFHNPCQNVLRTSLWTLRALWTLRTTTALLWWMLRALLSQHHDLHLLYQDLLVDVAPALGAVWL